MQARLMPFGVSSVFRGEENSESFQFICFDRPERDIDAPPDSPTMTRATMTSRSSSMAWSSKPSPPPPPATSIAPFASLFPPGDTPSPSGASSSRQPRDPHRQCRARAREPDRRMKSGVSSRTDTGFHSDFFLIEDTAAELWSRRTQPPRRFRPLPQRKSELTPVSALATTHSRFR